MSSPGADRISNANERSMDKITNKEDLEEDSDHSAKMNLRKFRKATAKKRQLIMDNKKKRKKSPNHREQQQQDSEAVHSSSESNNTMTLEQFTDIVLASEGMTLNNNNNKKNSISIEEVSQKNAMVATILQNKDLTVEVKPAKSKPVVLSPRDSLNFPANSVVVSVKPRLQQHSLVEEWLQKLPIQHGASDSALNLSIKSGGTTTGSSATRSSPIVNQYSNNGQVVVDSAKSRAIRDIQLAHTKDVHGNYPLHMAVLMRKSELVKRYCCVLQILESSLDLINDEKLTPLHLAVRDNSIEIIEILLDFGANPSVQDFRGNTCLHTAAAIRSVECLKVLAENMASKDDLNAFNNFGITPLHIAVMNDDKSCIELLLRYGADPKTLSDLTAKMNPPVLPKDNSMKKEINLDMRKNLLIHS